MIKKFAILLMIFLCSVSANAQEPFKIPNAQHKSLVGAWTVVKMGQGEEMEDVPEGRNMGMVFRADGSGLQTKGTREKLIKWGADDKGAFAAQWVQEDGNGDGILGTWEMTDEGLLLKGHEFEDAKGPAEDAFIVLMKRVEVKD